MKDIPPWEWTVGGFMRSDKERHWTTKLRVWSTDVSNVCQLSYNWGKGWELENEDNAQVALSEFRLNIFQLIPAEEGLEFGSECTGGGGGGV
jgi:hypothetical protein